MGMRQTQVEILLNRVDGYMKIDAWVVPRTEGVFVVHPVLKRAPGECDPTELDEHWWAFTHRPTGLACGNIMFDSRAKAVEAAQYLWEHVSEAGRRALKSSDAKRVRAAIGEDVLVKVRAMGETRIDT
jgi:hypothetical protein